MNFEHSRGEAPHLILSKVPEHLCRHTIPFAQVAYKAYKEAELLSQMLVGRDYSVSMHVLAVSDQIKMTANAKSDALLLGYLIQGRTKVYLHGYGQLDVGEREYRLYYIPANVQNTVSFAPGHYRFVHINFHPCHFIPVADQYPRFHPMLQRAQNKIREGSVGHAATITRYIDALLLKITQCDAGIAERTLIIESTIRELLLLYIRAPEPPKKSTAIADDQHYLLQQIEHYIESNLDADLSVRNIARKFNKGRSWLQRLVNRQFGKGLHELVTEKRMNEAAKLLLTTKMPVGEIVQSVSTMNFSSFCAAFMKRFSMSPLDYRKYAGQKRQK